jgi:hypothetical protein
VNTSKQSLSKPDFQAKTQPTMSDDLKTKNEQLLSAYLDGELNAADMERAKTLIDGNQEYAKLVADWKSNGGSIAELPKYKLSGSFVDKVISQIGSGKVTTKTSDPVAHSASWKTGLASLVALAAMLLLTLFVFPSQPKPTVVGDSGTSPESATHDSTEPLEMLSQPMYSRAKDPNAPANSEMVATSGFKGVQQMIQISADANGLRDLEDVFRKNEIKISEQRFDSKSESGFESIFIVSTASQMKKAIADLKRDSTIDVQAVSLTPQTVNETMNRRNATAMQLTPVVLKTNERPASATPEEIKEFERIDHWFGLTESNDSELVPYLLIINTAR